MSDFERDQGGSNQPEQDKDKSTDTASKKTKRTNELLLNIPEDKNAANRELGKLASFGGLGIIIVGGAVYFAINSLEGSGHQKTANSAPATHTSDSGTAYMANFDLSQLQVVLDKQGRVRGAFGLPNLRADEVDITAVCEDDNHDLFNNTEETILVYKSNLRKTGFSILRTTATQQTSITDISRFSKEVPSKFSKNGRIGTDTAIELAKTAHPEPCEEKGSLWKYQDAKIKSLIPTKAEAKGGDSLGGFVGLAVAVVCSGVAVEIARRRLRKDNSSKSKKGWGGVGIRKKQAPEPSHAETDQISKPVDPDKARAELSAKEDSTSAAERDGPGYGFYDPNKTD